MNKSKLFSFMVTLVIALCGCGDPGNIGDGSNLTLKQPSLAPNNISNQIYLDLYNSLTLDSTLEFRESSESSQEWATYFSWARNVRVNRITWLGKIDKNANLKDGKAIFFITFYSSAYEGGSVFPREIDDRDTEVQVRFEYLVEAEAHLVDSNESGDLYEFVYSDYSMFSAGAGNYWISIVGRESDGLNFNWVVNPEASTVDLGYLAVRDFHSGTWSSDVGGISSLSIKIEGGFPIPN